MCILAPKTTNMYILSKRGKAFLRYVLCCPDNTTAASNPHKCARVIWLPFELLLMVVYLTKSEYVLTFVIYVLSVDIQTFP